MERMIQSNFFQRIFENFPEMRQHKNLIVRPENMENKFQISQSFKVEREKELPKALRVGAEQKASYLIRPQRQGVTVSPTAFREDREVSGRQVLSSYLQVSHPLLFWEDHKAFHQDSD